LLDNTSSDEWYDAAKNTRGTQELTNAFGIAIDPLTIKLMGQDGINVAN
jgi:hypothetical protein